MKNSLRLFAAIATLIVLGACGNKGPLVHPTAPADELPVPATAAAPASIAPATPTDATVPAPATTAPAMPTDTTLPPPDDSVPPANGGG